MSITVKSSQDQCSCLFEGEDVGGAHDWRRGAVHGGVSHVHAKTGDEDIEDKDDEDDAYDDRVEDVGPLVVVSFVEVEPLGDYEDDSCCHLNEFGKKIMRI